MNTSMTRRAWLAPALAGLLLLAGCAERGPDAVAAGFYRAVAAGDADTAVALVRFHDDGGDAVTQHMDTRLAIASMQAEITLAGGLDAVEVERIEPLDDTHVIVHLSLHLGNGRTQTDRTTLVHTGDGWKIAG